jgi:hypothetical protein
MFTPSTWFFISKELADKWATLEEALHINQTQSLAKGYSKGIDEWTAQQMGNLSNYQQNALKLAKSAFKSINADTVEAIRKALSMASEETLKAIGIENPSEDKEVYATAITLARDNVNKGLNALVQQAIKTQTSMINTISSVANFNRGNVKYQFNMRTSDETSVLFNEIKRVSEVGIQNGYKVIYSNGREMPFKSYMEMSIRTTVQNMALDMMEKSAGNLGIVFFLCSEHSDSADDHAQYQGKVYISDNWRSKITDPEITRKIEDYISKHNTMTVEQVKGEPVWLTTRPNCRHFFTPITLNQALDLLATKEQLKTVRGTYLQENYEDLKEQRYDERHVRFYRSRRDNARALLENAKPEDKAKLQSVIAYNTHMMTKWRTEVRTLVKKNPNLKREYRRENNAKMAQDLGVTIERKLDLE